MYTKHKGPSSLIALVSKLEKEAWDTVPSESEVINKEGSHADFHVVWNLPTFKNFDYNKTSYTLCLFFSAHSINNNELVL